MRIVTLNLNGIRSAHTKGLLAWMASEQADVFCVQELKAQAADMRQDMLSPLNYFGYFHYAEKKGYSGVGLYTRRQPDDVIIGLDIPKFDAEGRYLEARFGNLSIVSVYLPSGSSGDERQSIKFEFLEIFLPHLVSLRNSGREVIVCGDLNIAHTEKDLKNWRGNKKNSGFLPEERAWMSQLLGDGGYIDVFRQLYPDLELYTWWSNRGQAWAKDVGWRIDYQLATPDIAKTAVSASIYKAQRFSDHAPLTVDYDIRSE